LYASGRVYFFSKRGQVSVIAADRDFELLAKNQLDGELIASPAIAHHALILRSTSHLYCFASGPLQAER
jgi:hypothetical protein